MKSDFAQIVLGILLGVLGSIAIILAPGIMDSMDDTPDHDITILGTIEGGHQFEGERRYLGRVIVESVTRGEEAGSFPIGDIIIAEFDDDRIMSVGAGDRIVIYCDVRIPGGAQPTFVENCWLASPVVTHEAPDPFFLPELDG